MVARLHRGIGALIWRGLIAGVISLAVYVAGARVVLQSLPQYQEAIVARLAKLLTIEIRIDSMSGELNGFTPEIVLTNLSLILPGEKEVVLETSNAALTLDPWASLLALEPRLDSLTIRYGQLGLNARQLLEGEGGADLSALTDVLRVFRKVTVDEALLKLTGTDAAVNEFTLDIEMRRRGSERQLQARLSDDDGNELVVEGSGIGNLFDPANFTGELHGRLKSEDLGELSQIVTETDLAGTLALDFWYSVQNQMPLVTARVNLSDLHVGDVSLARVSFDTVVRPTEQGWSSTLVDSYFFSASHTATIDKLQWEKRGRAMRLRSADVAVADVTQVLLDSGLLQGAANDIVATLAPSGQVVALEAQIEDFDTPLSGWSLSAEVIDATTQPINNVPGLAGIDASIEANQDGAQAWIDTQNFGLYLPNVYSSVLNFERILGKLSGRWRSGALFLEDGVLVASAGDHQAHVQFGIDIPLDDANADAPPLAMYLSAGFDDTPAAFGLRYVPDVIGTELYQWLDQAAIAGDISSGVFVWRGGFDSFGSGGQSMQVGLALESTEFQFRPDWPALADTSAVLAVDTFRVSVWGNSAQLSGMQLADVSVELESDPSVGLIKVAGVGQGLAADGLNLLRESPIYGIAQPVLDDISLEGFIHGELGLVLDMYSASAEPEVNVALQIEGGALESNILMLSATDVSGDLRFDSKVGFTSQQLLASVFDNPVEVQLGAGSSGMDDAGILDAKLKLLFPLNQASSWLAAISGLDSLPDFELSQLPANGSTSVTVRLGVGAETTVGISTDLAGISIDLPAPMGKPSEVYSPLEVNFTVGDHPWDIFWYRRLQGRVYREAGEFIGAAVDLTPRWRPGALTDPSSREGLHVSGRLPWIELEPWLAALDTLPSLNMGAPEAALTIADVSLQTVVFGGVNLGPITIDLTPFDTWDMLGVNADWLDAELTLHRNQQSTALIINDLNLDLMPDLLAGSQLPQRASSDGSREDEASPVGDDLASEVDGASRLTTHPEPPELTAPLDVIIANLRHQGQSLGAASFVITSGDGVLEARDIRGNLADIDLGEGSRLQWRRVADADVGVSPFVTTLALNGTVRNLGNTFKALAIEPVVETRSGRMLAELSWPGGPSEIDLLALSGAVEIQLREGSFLPVPSGATGFVRLLSLLNLAGLFERANVTRLFEPGVAFKKAAGVVSFQPGSIEIPDFRIDGPGGGFQFDSDIDLITQTIDGELVVTLPLVDNIPWVAALTAGLPVAAGAYLVSKVFEDQVKSLSSGVYSVSGELAQPEVKFLRVFDATSNRARVTDDPAGGDTPAATAVPEGIEPKSGTVPETLEQEENSDEVGDVSVDKTREPTKFNDSDEGLPE